MNDNEHAIARKILTNIRSTRVMARETPFDILLEMQKKLNIVVEEQREEAELEKAIKNQLAKKREEMLTMLAAEGLKVEDLLYSSNFSGNKKRIARVAPKYQYEVNGETKYWSGRGRSPKPIAEALAAGKTLDDFFIIDEE